MAEELKPPHRDTGSSNTKHLRPSTCLRSILRGSMDRVLRLSAQRAVVIFSMSSCCMCHSIKKLFTEMGVNPAVHELDEDPKGKDMARALVKMLGHSPAVPAVFIGCNLVGSTHEVMTLHLGGKLVPLLRAAGALWV